MATSNRSQSRRLARRRDVGAQAWPDDEFENAVAPRGQQEVYHRQARMGLALLFLTFTVAVVVYAAMSLPHLVGWAGRAWLPLSVL